MIDAWLNRKQIEGLSNRVQMLRERGSLSSDVLWRLRRYFKLKNIYHSNAIEGNVLDIGETRQVVEAGLTLTGKPLKDQAEANNLSHALDFLEELARENERPITEHDIRQIHALILAGIDDENAGVYRTRDVRISGSEYEPMPPESIPAEMKALGEWLSEVSVPDTAFATSEAILRASAAHTWLVYIHPFIDGNGRVSRLLMNLLLMRYGYPIAIITKEDRLRYYDALEESQSSNLSPFVSLVTESLEESLEEWERAAEQQRQDEEWALAIAQQFTEPERNVALNDYEVWKSAMDLFRGYVRQTATRINEASAGLGRVYFKDFGMLEFEKYASLRSGESAKRTWFFRVDFRRRDQAARYLFFFGSPSMTLRGQCDVTVHIAREESPFDFERLQSLPGTSVPQFVEVGYLPGEERFIAKRQDDNTRTDRIERIASQFIDDVVRLHF